MVRRRAESGNRGRRGDRPQPCDGGGLRGLPSRSSGVGEPKGFRKIWAQPGAPLIHKLNLSVLRVLGAILSLAAMFAVGALLALIFKFVRS